MQLQFNALRSQQEIKTRERKGRIHPNQNPVGENKKLKF